MTAFGGIHQALVLRLLEISATISKSKVAMSNSKLRLTRLRTTRRLPRKLRKGTFASNSKKLHKQTKSKDSTISFGISKPATARFSKKRTTYCYKSGQQSK